MGEIIMQFDLRENEFMRNGLPYCSKCGKPHFFKFENFITRCICDCVVEEQKKEQEKIEMERRKIIFAKKQQYAGLPEKYKSARFDNATIDKGNKEIYDRAKTYCSKFEDILNNNLGIYFFGENGSGKTHLTACICNEILANTDYLVKFTSITRLIQEMQSSYNYDNNITIAEILTKIKEFDLVIIDDLGKEFLGGKSAYAERMLYEIINARYNANKPVIFSSNFTIKQLMEDLRVDRAIVERIGEMSNRIIKVEGHNFRKENYSSKTDILKEMGI